MSNILTISYLVTGIIAFNYQRRKEAFRHRVYQVIGNRKYKYHSGVDELSKLPGFWTPFDSQMAFGVFKGVAELSYKPDTDIIVINDTQSFITPWDSVVSIEKNSCGNIILKSTLIS